MGCLLNTVIVFLLVGLTASSKHTYKAASVGRQPLGLDAYAQVVQDAAGANVDLLVLPTLQDIPSYPRADNFNEVVETISSLANKSKIYVVSHLLEKVRCQDKTEVIKSNLVFNRRGNIISVYRKPLDPTASCNATTPETSSFTTDFGVTFGVLMPEDLVLRNLADGGKNFVVAGDWESEIAVLAAPQFYTTWAFTTNANLVSSSGVFAGKAGQIGQGTDFFAAELNKDGEDSINPPIVTSSLRPEDLSHYSIKPLDLVTSSQGIRETVCHGQFCCQFYVKTSSSGTKNLNYGLAVFEGIRHYGGHHNIGTQHCAVLPCVGATSCDVGSINNTKIVFDEVSITGNFKLENSAQLPTILSTESMSNSEFQFDNKCQNDTNQVSVRMHNGHNLLNFGIFGRDFSKDNTEKNVIYYNIGSNDGLTYKIYEYINSEEVLYFCDYLWVRLRVLIFVVSIYVLEMM